MLHDIQFAARTLRRNPGFTLAAVLTLALGIGANTALFSVADAVLLKPLPYPEPQRIYRIREAPLGMARTGGFVVARALRESPILSGVGIYAAGGLNVGSDDAAVRVNAASVTPGFFSALGSSPIAGRVFTDADVSANARVAVISHSLWRARFNADDSLVGRSIEVNGRPFLVLGVMPPRFTFPDFSEVWIPAGSDNQITGAVLAPEVVGRLPPGVTAAQAQDEILRIKQVRASAAGVEDNDPVTLVPLREELTGTVRPLLIVVSCAVLLVLLVACINTANLMLARVSARDREMAVRRALGASNRRLMRYLLCESALVSALAAIAAVPAALWTLDIVRALLPATLHGAQEIALDGRAAGATAALAVLATVLFGIAPVGSLRGGSTAHALRGGSSTSTPFWRRFRMVLVASELAAAVVLLAGAVTVVKTVSSVLAVDLGARGERVLTLQLTLPLARYPTAAHATAFYDRLHERLQAPGIEAAAAASSMPGFREIGIARGMQIDGMTPLKGEASASFVKATPQYFSALGIDLIAGRIFAETDRAQAPRVAIVSERVAQLHGLRPAEVVGRSVVLGTKPREVATVVGVVRDVRLRGPEVPIGKQVYVPFAQDEEITPLYVIVKGAGEPRALIPAVRSAVAQVDPSLPPYNIRTFDDVRATYVADRRFAMIVMLLFAGLTVALSAIGLYGVVSYLTQLSIREIGIRIALGATPGNLLRQTMRAGLINAAAGVVAGAVLAAAASRIVISRVPGIQQVTPSTLALTGLTIVALAALTVWIPARRAARVDPIEALRAEG